MRCDMDKIIQLKTSDSFTYTESGELKIRVSGKTGNTLTIEPDGLYAQAVPGQPGPSGSGFVDGYRSANGVTSGVATPQDMTSTPKRIVGPTIMHRVFNCLNADGSDLALRSVDLVYPGDMYRVRDDVHGNWDYYVITKVASNGITVTGHSAKVAEIPILAEDVN